MTAPVRAEGLTEVVLDGETVVYDGEDLHHLDASATAVWGLVDGHRSRRRIVRHLAQVFGEPEELLEADVNALLATLRERGLLA